MDLCYATHQQQLINLPHSLLLWQALIDESLCQVLLLAQF